MAVMVDTGVHRALVPRKHSSLEIFGNKLEMPEDIALILSKSGVDRCRDGRIISLTRKECRQTDGFSALYNRRWWCEKVAK